MRVGAGGFFFTKVDVGRRQRVVVHQRGVERQLGVFLPVLDALRRHGARLRLVVDQQRVSISLAINAVQLADQLQLAHGHLPLGLRLHETRPLGLVAGQPCEVALAHTRPDRGKRQELAVAQGHRLRDPFSRQVNHGFTRRQFGGWRGFQRLMEIAQNTVQPVAEVTFVQFAVQLAGLLQAQLAQCKKAVGTAAQVFIGTGRQPGHRQGLARGHGTRRGPDRDWAQAAGVSRQGWTVALPGLREQQFLHKTAGNQVLTGLAGAPKQVHMLQLQDVVPGRAIGASQHVTRGQAQDFALSGRPETRRLGRNRQADFIAAG